MRFSVIIPLYNKVDYIAKAIASVLAQSFKDYELVVVDDGSIDGSFEIAMRHTENLGFCRLIKQENAGVSAARNKGVSLAQGDFVCFLDADDWWDPCFLEEMSKLIDDFSDGGIYGTNYIIVNERSRRTRVATIGVDAGFERGYINYCQVYAKTMYMPLWTGAVCIPRMVFDEIGGFPIGVKLGEDFLLWMRIALKYNVVFLNKPLAYYNQDVVIANRSVGKLHNPKSHLLWNLEFICQEERTGTDYKQLIDNLRTYNLLPYYISKEYHGLAQMELDKVDWNRQSKKTLKLYQRPMSCIRMQYALRVVGSRLKQEVLKIIKKEL